jgi:hypothetical protein
MAPFSEPETSLATDVSADLKALLDMSHDKHATPSQLAPGHPGTEHFPDCTRWTRRDRSVQVRCSVRCGNSGN